MNLDAALRRYRTGQFTDADVTHCTGLSVRAWRELIKLRAVRTITEERGRGRVRLCDATVLKRAAVIAALNRTGLSLSVSGQVAGALPFRTLLYEICDPSAILLRSAGLDPQTGLPPRLERPKADWFDSNKPAEFDPASDWLLEIYQGRFVGAIFNAEEAPTMFGDLRDDGASFVAWFPFRRRFHQMGRVIESFALDRPGLYDAAAAWEDPTEWYRELKRLGYKFEKHDTDDDPLCLAAEAAARSPVFKTTINATLAIRKSLRRYLGIEPTESSSKPEFQKRRKPR